MRGFSFSLKRFLVITLVKLQFSRQTGIPTTKNGLERKIGSLQTSFGKMISESISGAI
jgi:hypothetical protein